MLGSLSVLYSCGSQHGVLGGVALGAKVERRYSRSPNFPLRLGQVLVHGSTSSTCNLFFGTEEQAST